MKIAFVICNDVTLLDFAGDCDPLTRLKSMGFVPDLSWDVCARTPTVRSIEGTELVPACVGNDLSAYDYMIIPGGDGIKGLMRDPVFLRWISVASEKTTIAAVCGGVLLLGAAGFLRERRATTHPELQAILKNFAREVSTNRIVDEGCIITAGGVTSLIDLGLSLRKDCRAGCAGEDPEADGLPALFHSMNGSGCCLFSLDRNAIPVVP